MRNSLAFLFLSIIGLLVGLLFLRSFGSEFLRPEYGTYSGDERMYLQTFYFLEDGIDFYQALPLAQKGDASGKVLTQDVFTWRLPGVFVLWALLGNQGEHIVLLFFTLVTLALGALCLMIWKLTKHWLQAAVGVLLVGLYVASLWIYPTALLFHEWWAWIMLIFAYALLLFGRPKFAYGFFVMALFIRELSLIAIVGSLAAAFWLKSMRRYFLSLVILGITILVLHSSLVLQQFPTDVASGNIDSLVSRFRLPSSSTILPMIAFGTQWFPLKEYKIQLFLVGFALAGLWWRRAIIVSSHFVFFAAGTLSLFITLPFMVTSSQTPYWGIMFAPSLLALVGLCIPRHQIVKKE